MKYWKIGISLISMAGLIACTEPKTSQSSLSTSQKASSIQKQDSLKSTILSSSLELSKEEANQEKLNIQIGEYRFTATLAENAATQELIRLLQENPLTLELEDYGGFEKVGGLRMTLPTQDQQISTSPGDIILYNGNNIVIFYGSNTWSYTKLGSIDDLTNLEDALAPENVSIQLSL